MHTAQVIIELKDGKIIPLTPIKGAESLTFTGLGVDRSVTVFQSGVATVVSEDNSLIRLDARLPVVSGEKAAMGAVKEIRLI